MARTSGASGRQPDDVPSFSADGKRILFASHGTGTEQILTMGLDGKNQERITHDAFDNFGPTFAPDGEEIAFASTRTGHEQIFVVRTDGSHLSRLTHDSDDDTL